MIKSIITALFLLVATFSFAQTPVTPADKFWSELQKMCGKSFEGKLKEGVTHPDFTGKKLVMHVRSCEPNRIRIPFFVGDDRSRTWVLTKKDGVITLKHDHRHEDGSEDKITQYGGTAANVGFDNLQMFPADVETATRIPYASTNVWWITLKDGVYSYNLKRIGSDREISVLFDLTKEVATPEKPWGFID